MTSATERQVNQRIDEARRILKPSPVRLHHVPDFFRRRLLRVYGCSYGDNSGYGALGHAERKNGWHWIDHPGSTTYRGRPAFVSEPYQLSCEDHSSIDALCRECGLAYFIDANSWWNPGQTLRVLIYEPEADQCPQRHRFLPATPAEGGLGNWSQI